jgi:two-component system sensor histidine kinase MtrB
MSHPLSTPVQPERDDAAEPALPPAGWRADVIHAVKRVLRSMGPLGQRLLPGLRLAHRAWRRSLQLRVIMITVITSGLVVTAFSFLVAKRATDALVDGARERVEAQLQEGANYAALQLGSYTRPNDSGVDKTIDDILDRLKVTPEQGGGVIVAMIIAPDPMEGDFKTAPNQYDDNIKQGISVALRERVTAGNIAHQVVTADLSPNGGQPPVTYMVYGRGVPTTWSGGDRVQIYYLVPLTTEEKVADEFRTTIAIFGFLLVVVLAVVVSLIMRMVVSPVRIAARTAQRLSAGLLDQRMEVNGEDDLALLATAFNQMAGNLQRQIVRLEEMSRLQRRFTSDVSHELRTPLTTVRMAADLLYSEREEFDPAVARSAELLQHELDRFESLLSDLLEISRFDAGFAMADLEPTDLAPIVERVVERLESVAQRAGVPVEVVIPTRPVIAEIDPRRVERILRNLVGNAVEHGEGRPVVVTLAAAESCVAVTVRDRGVGLKPGEEKLVFNRFWRADPSRARQTGGTGLGLSIALEDAKLHGGRLEAWGSPGRGAQFRLTLPTRSGDRITHSALPLVPEDDAVVPAQATGEQRERVVAG